MMITKESLLSQILGSEIIQAGLAADSENQIEKIISDWERNHVEDAQCPIESYLDLNSEDPDEGDEGVVLLTTPGKSVGIGEACNSHVRLVKLYDYPEKPFFVELLTEPYSWDANAETEIILGQSFKNLDEALEVIAKIHNAENTFVREFEWDEENNTVDVSPSSSRLAREAKWARENAAEQERLYGANSPGANYWREDH